MMMSKEQEDIKVYQVTELTWRQVTSTREKRIDEETDFFFFFFNQTAKILSALGFKRDSPDEEGNRVNV